MSEQKAYRDVLDVVLHSIPDAGSINPTDAASRFASDHFEGHIRVVAGLSSDEGFRKGRDGWTWSGLVHLAEDDDYRASNYRMTFNPKRSSWEFRAPLD
jgi:hypothetical protein